MIKKYSIINGAKYFFSDGLQNFLVFISISKCRHLFSSTPKTYSLKSNGIPEESNKNTSTRDNSFVPKWIYGYQLPRVKFNGNSLRQYIVSFIHKNVVNLYIT